MSQGNIVVVTGGASGIGRCIAQHFTQAGDTVCIIDLKENPYFVGDLSQEETLTAFAQKVIADHGRVDYLINNALPLKKGLADCTFQEFNYALAVGVTAPFMLCKLFAPHFSPQASVVNIASCRDRMSQPQSESYAAAKGGIAALTHALAMTLGGVARVNSISPGWINTTETDITGPDALQQPVGRVGTPEDIAHMVAFLCSPQSSFLTGENICIDGGMTRQLVYHGECGWHFDPQEK